jgi:hypothetical protein
MASRLDDLLDAAIVLGAAGLHVLAVRRLDALPPSGAFETVLLVLPLVAQLLAVVLLVGRRDRRGLQGACLLQWLLVLYTLPASFLGVSFVPAAAVLTLALYRPRRLSSARSGGG